MRLPHDAFLDMIDCHWETDSVAAFQDAAQGVKPCTHASSQMAHTQAVHGEAQYLGESSSAGGSCKGAARSAAAQLSSAICTCSTSSITGATCTCGKSSGSSR